MKEGTLEKLQRPGYRAFLAVESWMNGCFGNPANPLYHLGTLTFYFFWVVLVSGLYLFLFWDTQVKEAYASVEYITHDQWYLAGVMRSLHRYASDAAVVTVFLHMVREFFRDRHRGLRWFSWFTGVPTLWLVVLLGISGYWLVWDQLALYIAVTTAKLIDWLPALPSSMALNFMEGKMTDRFFILMAFLHLLAFPVLLVFALWVHVSRISRVGILPPRSLVIGSTIGLLLISALKPALSHGPADPFQVPFAYQIDWFYLNVYPLMDRFGPGPVWLFSSGITLLIMVLPWLPRKQPEAMPVVDLAHCNGCGQCWLDCPFGAITMFPRTDGRKFEKEPSVDDSLCTSCGICAGSCPSSNFHRQRGGTLVTGIDMPQLPVHKVREEVDRALAGLSGTDRYVVFGCRHGVDVETLQAADVAAVKVICSGMLPPSFVDYLLKREVRGVFITGCREGDCFFRLGNVWTPARLDGEREPHLVKRVERQRVGRHWGGKGDEQELARVFAAFRQQLMSREMA